MKILRFFNAVVFILLLLMPAVLNAQDGFGFGESDFGSSGSSSFSVQIGGEISAEFTGFHDDFSSADRIRNTGLGDIFSGSLNFNAGASAAEGVINLNLSPVFDGSSPVEIDEAYLRAFFGPVTVEGGIRKLTWGKADSFGPLDVINPLDYTDLTRLSDPQSIKIGRPMIRGIWSPGSFTKLEAVFVPAFQGHSFATSGRWAPAQVTELREGIAGALDATRGGIEQYPVVILPDSEKAALLSAISGIAGNLENSIESGDLYPETNTLEYAQAGMRFTGSIGSNDFGIQYYFGRFPRPVITGLNPRSFFTPPSPPSSPSLLDIHPEALNPDINYNYFHQIGVDYARVIAGFNLRAEAGANITSDLDGTDGETENPALVWSLGFDRDLFWEINLNLQGTGRLRLFHGEIGDDPLSDCEAGSSMSSTRITAVISRSFLRDELELKVSGLWGIEDKDFLVMPSIAWSRNDVSAELSAGFFGGDKKGELGQYRDNGFARLILTYTF